MWLNAFWIALIVFLILTILSSSNTYKILDYLMKNHKAVYRRYNQYKLSGFLLFMTPLLLIPLEIDLLFTKKLLLDDNLKRMIKIDRALAILHPISLFVFVYAYNSIVH